MTLKSKILFLSLVLLNALLIVEVLYACLRPFEFKPVNKVTWHFDSTAVRLDNPSILLSDPVTPSDSTLQTAIALAISPYSWLPLYHESRILSFCDTAWNEKFFIGQNYTNLIVRNCAANGTGRSEAIVKGLLPGNAQKRIAVILRNTGTEIFVGGEKVLADPLVLSDRFGRGRFLIGKGPQKEHQWMGFLSGCAIYRGRFDSAAGVLLSSRPTREVDSAAKLLACFLPGRSPVRNVDFTIPAYFPILKKQFLALPEDKLDGRGTQSLYIDMVENVIGFMPFGFLFSALLAMLLRKRLALHLILVTTLAGFLFSLLIETVQVWEYARTSELFDVICNTLGALTGAALLGGLRWVGRRVSGRG